jgi:hypothetical protein
MTTRNAYLRVAAGLVAIALLYAGPWAVGIITAGERLAPCLAKAQQPADIVIKLAFIPGPTELEYLQTFGRYGGSGGDMHNVVLLRVAKAKQQELARIYWISEIAPAGACAP